MRHLITFVSNGLGVGGAERQLYEFMRMRPPDIDVNLIYLGAHEEDGPLRLSYQALGIPATLINRRELSFASFFLALLRELSARRPQVVHTFLAGSPSVWGRAAALAVGVPAIVHSDRSTEFQYSRVQSVLRPLLDRCTTRFMPNARAIADRLVREGTPSSKVRVVRNGVDLSRFTPGPKFVARSLWGIPEAAVVAGFLGKFRPEKRVDLLLEAILLLPEEARPDFVMLGGDGPLMDDIRMQVDAEPWLRSRVRLTGLVPDAAAFIRGLDYLVLCSDFEGLPNAVLEAMALGKPVVSTRVSDVPDLISGCGFVAETGDAAGLAAAISQMTSLSTFEREAMGAVARDCIRREFELSVAGQSFWEAHLELLS